MEYLASPDSYSCHRWIWPKQQQLPKNASKLTSQATLGSRFLNIIGTTNASFIFGIDDDALFTLVFESLLEKELTRLALLNGNNAVKHFTKNIYLTIDNISPDGNICVYSGKNLTTSKRWCELGINFFHISKLNVMATFAEMANMDPANLYRLTSGIMNELHTFQHPYSHETRYSIIPNTFVDETSVDMTILPSTLTLNSPWRNEICIQQEEVRLLKDCAKSVRGALSVWRIGREHFCLPADLTMSLEGICGAALCIGGKKPKALFLNQEQFQESIGIPIILFQDSRVALKILSLIDACPNCSSDSFIISAHFGSDLELFDWSSLYGHVLIFVPAPTVESIAMAKAYMEYSCQNCSKFMISSKFVLSYKPDDGNSPTSNGLMPVEDHILKNCSYVDDWINPSKMLEKLIHESISFEAFNQNFQEFGIIKPDRNQQCNLVASKNNIFKRLHDLPLPQENTGNEVRVAQFFSSGFCTMIYGDTNVGKSWLGLELAISVACGKDFLQMKNDIATQVAYIDGEIRTSIRNRIEQLCMDLSEDQKKLVARNIMVWQPEDNTSFTSQVDELVLACRDNCIKMLIIDNLVSVLPNAWKNGQKFFEVIDKFCSLGISVVLIHHLGKDGNDYLGSSIYQDRMQNIIRLIDLRKMTTKDLDNFGINEFDINEYHSGSLVCIYLEKEKIAPYWNGKISVWYLPINNTWKCIRPWPNCLYHSGANNEENTDGLTQLNIPSDMPEDEKQLLSYFIKAHSSLPRNVIDAEFGWSESKTLQVLNSLMDQNYIVKEGVGKKTRYHVNNASA